MKYQQEFLTKVKSESLGLIAEHYEELSSDKDLYELNPRWEDYEHLELLNLLRLFTVRTDEGVLVGYLLATLQPAPHHNDTLFSHAHAMFLRKSFRKGFTGINLIKFAEDCLKSDGVDKMFITTKVKSDFPQLMKRLGYSPDEITYSKNIGAF